MLKTRKVTATDWRERARLFFEARRKDEIEEQPPRFSIITYHVPRTNGVKYYVKNPCPHENCNGRVFLERELHTWRLVMKCIACSRQWTVRDYEKLSRHKVDITLQ